ncbi:hypothetical protein JOQ06_002628, partial [Pogonophryne albipinna]
TSGSCLLWRNKELKLHAGKGRWAPGDRRKVPYEILKETGDGARERLSFLFISSSSQQCACSGEERTILPAKVNQPPPPFPVRPPPFTRCAMDSQGPIAYLCTRHGLGVHKGGI